jgi:hypothetical protein
MGRYKKNLALLGESLMAFASKSIKPVNLVGFSGDSKTSLQKHKRFVAVPDMRDELLDELLGL